MSQQQQQQVVFARCGRWSAITCFQAAWLLRDDGAEVGQQCEWCSKSELRSCDVVQLAAMSRQQHQQRQQQLRFASLVGAFRLPSHDGADARQQCVSGWKQALWCGVADSVMPFISAFAGGCAAD
jgi:hypothetical protein